MEVDVPRLLVRLKIDASPRGAEFWARCPFPDHDERTPSFQIRSEPGSERNAWWSCHGCGRSGGPVGLVASLLDVEPRDARKWLHESGTADSDLRVFEQVETRGGIVKPRFELPAAVQFAPLERWPSPMRVYLEGRGVTAREVEEWGIGFALTGRLAHRIVIVKRDANGTPFGYSARAYTGRARKYIEPATKDDPKSGLKNEHPDLGVMFGEQHWPMAGARRIVVASEGAFDLLAARRVTGFPVAGLSGSVPSPTHLAKLATFDRVVLAFDPDNAGDKATRTLLDAFGRLDVRPVEVPDGHDLNSLERSDGGAERLRDLLLAAAE